MLAFTQVPVIVSSKLNKIIFGCFDPLNIVLYIEHARFLFLRYLTNISAEIKSLVPKNTTQSTGEDFATSLEAVQGKT